MDVAVSTCDLHAEGSLMENTSAEMSTVAPRQTWASWMAENQIIAWNCPLGAPDSSYRIMNTAHIILFPNFMCISRLLISLLCSCQISIKETTTTTITTTTTTTTTADPLLTDVSHT